MQIFIPFFSIKNFNNHEERRERKYFRLEDSNVSELSSMHVLVVYSYFVLEECEECLQEASRGWWLVNREKASKRERQIVSSATPARCSNIRCEGGLSCNDMPFIS